MTVVSRAARALAFAVVCGTALLPGAWTSTDLAALAKTEGGEFDGWGAAVVN